LTSDAMNKHALTFLRLTAEWYYATGAKKERLLKRANKAIAACTAEEKNEMQTALRSLKKKLKNLDFRLRL